MSVTSNDNTVASCDLHGVAIPVEAEERRWYKKNSPVIDSADDVFFDDEESVHDEIMECGIERSKSFSRKRKQISKSSGYESETTGKNSLLVESFDKFKLNNSCRRVERKIVFSQTNFSSDDAAILLNSIKVAKTLQPGKKGKFCWRHDNIYDQQLFPPARPSSKSSEKKLLENEKYFRSTQKISITNKFCRICKMEETLKIDLSSRKDLSRLKKEVFFPAVAEVKDCAINLLADQIENCSNLWTENRTFFLGTPIKSSCRNLKQFKSHSFPNVTDEPLHTKKFYCYYCDNISVCGEEHNYHRSCSQHLFWIQKASFASEKTLFMRREKLQRNKRDWILVQCVTKFLLSNKSSSNCSIKVSYRGCGEQEMILCPYDLRSIEYIEEVCCQHFINITRNEALKENRAIELLFSSKGPIVREDKHIEGRSIFYFCCDAPFKSKSEKKFKSSKKSDLLETNKSQEESEELKIVSSLAQERTNNEEKFKSEKVTPTNEKIIFDTDQLTQQNDEAMKKSVKFADEQVKSNINNEVNANKNLEKQLKNEKNLGRRPSVPPPPPNFLGENEKEEFYHSGKRRESIAIAFGNGKNSSKEKTEKKSTFNEDATKVFKLYHNPTWSEVDVSVSYKDQKYVKKFLEYNTLEDLYSWVKKELLKNNLYKPGADLILSSKYQNFPLKANTASHTVMDLPVTDLICSQVCQIKRDSGFDDSTSRYETRFGLPVDLRNLDNLTPIEYLSKYCSVNETWKLFYESIFNQFDLNRDGFLSYKELKSAMEKLFVELAQALLKKTIVLLGFDSLSASDDHSFLHDSSKTESETRTEKLSIDRTTFVLLCALANRIICRENKIDGYSVENVKQSNTHLEDADFYNIEGKLKECRIHPLTKKLLIYIKK